jgi:hypothetical protein
LPTEDSSEPEVLYRLTDADCRAIVTTDERSMLVARLRPEVPNLATVILADRGPERAVGPRLSDPGHGGARARARLSATSFETC